ncbi:MAG: tRNA-binding protein [Gemmatimonadales bacterium]|nr:tRNA-binding protein [Gemmatimonadales bacterium]
MITTLEFDAVDVRVGEIIAAELNAGARKPALVLTIDFGPELGTRISSAQLTIHYTPETLRGRRVLAVVNFPPRRVAGVKSEVLVLGVPDEDGAVVLVSPDRDTPLGGRLF